MTTSGTWNFRLDVADILDEAWERCHKNPDNLTGRMLASARRSLMLMLIDWANRGINLWAVDIQTVTLTAGVNSIVSVPATTDLLECNLIAVSGLEQPMNVLGRADWMALSNKAMPGPPTQLWVEKVLPVPVIHVFPTPDRAYQMRYSRIRLPMDVSAASQNPEAPALWLEALCAGLAERIAKKWVDDKELRAELKTDADTTYASAASENRERVPFIVRPNVG